MTIQSRTVITDKKFATLPTNTDDATLPTITGRSDNHFIGYVDVFPTKLIRMLIKRLLVVILITVTRVLSETDIDPLGYVAYCPCMGK